MTDDYETQRDCAVVELMKLDAEGCRLVATIARAMLAYADWQPENIEQIAAFHDILGILLHPVDFEYVAHELLPLAEARVRYQDKIEQEKAAWQRYAKRHRQKRAAQQARLEKIGLHLVTDTPEPDDLDPA